MLATITTGNNGLRRALPLACGCAAVGLAAVVAANDPAAADSRFPVCLFRASTGLWCPGCGLTRGMHQLLNGHVASALHYNVFLPLVVAAVGLGWWSWMRASWDRQPPRLPVWLVRPLTWGLPSALIIYGVLRNIPVAPFSTLAPQ
ncbi:MAG: DUF2752 domain-containing protein [Actinobacteria bacterium]|nr:DUF2752 domain-containing protein [Actinomycetota bacterium]